MAANQGKTEAQNNLGMMYHKGSGVTQDNRGAMLWYLKAAEQGNAEAQYNLGMMYNQGAGVPTDLVQACKWFNLAVLAGNEDAQRTIKLLEDRMTHEQIELALAMAREWMEKHK